MRHVAVIALTLSAVSLAAAHPEPQGRGRSRGQAEASIRFQAMDANGDRAITRREWRGSARSFEVHDWNGDGVLSGVELEIGARRPGRGRGSARDLESPWNELTVDDWTVEHFSDMDRDDNGHVNAAEWLYDRETFRRIDHNGDNAVSQTEFLGGVDVDDDAGDRFEYLDADNDGRVSRAEWHGTRARFDALDRDRNGFLTRVEAAGSDPPRDLFDAVDGNSDDAITRNEWRWSAASFDARDADRNGRLTREEFSGVLPTRSTAYRAGYDRGLIEGRQAGREDRDRKQGWDLEGQRELEQADSGYQASVGPRTEYQSGYREGFRRGYREAWNRR